MTPKERAYAAWSGEPTDRLAVQPICMSFAARDGGAKFADYARDHRVLASCQIRAAETYGFDIVSMTSDPCREASDCGTGVLWFDDEPPMPDPDRPRIREKADLQGMTVPNPLGGGRMHECCKGIALLKEQVGDRYPILGWVEGPIAEAADLRGLTQTIEDLVDDPSFACDLFEFVVEMELAYARAQIDAGADMIGIGDAAASLVSPSLYEEYVWPYEKKLVDGLRRMGTKVRLHICGNINHLLPGIARLDVDLVDVDCLTDLRLARATIHAHVPLLGNADPVADIRSGPPSRILEVLRRCHSDVGERFIVGAGCELPPDTAPEHVRALSEYAKSATTWP